MPAHPEGQQTEFYGNTQDDEVQAADPPAYDGPPLEGYYSPDRKDAKFPPDAMGGQSSYQGQSLQQIQQANPSPISQAQKQYAPSASHQAQQHRITPSPRFSAQGQQINPSNIQGQRQATTPSPNSRLENPLHRSPQPFATSSRSNTHNLPSSTFKNRSAEGDDTPPPPPPKDEKPAKVPRSHRSTLPARFPSQPVSQHISGNASQSVSHQATRSISESSRPIARQAAQRNHRSPVQMTPTKRIQLQGSSQSKRKPPSSQEHKRLSQAIVSPSPSSTRQENTPPRPEETQYHQDQRSRTQPSSDAYAPAPAHESPSRPEDRSRRNHQSLPLLNTSTSHVAQSRSHSATMTQDELRRARREEIENAGRLDAAVRAKEAEAPEVVKKVGDRVADKGRGGKDEDEGEEEEKIVMSSTSYPGQEWHPDYEVWED